MTISREDILLFVEDRLKGNKVTIGSEQEFIVVSKDRHRFGEAISPSENQELIERLVEGYNLHPIKNSERIIGGYRNISGGQFEIKQELGSGTIELTFPHHNDIKTIENQHHLMLYLLTSLLEEQNMCILDYAIQPVSKPSPELIIPGHNLEQLCKSVKKTNLSFQSITAASQWHVKVPQEKVIPAYNFLNQITPLLVGLFGNSPIYGKKISGSKAFRIECWSKFVEGTQYTNRVGNSQEISSIEDYVDQLLQLEVLGIKRKDTYLNPHRKNSFLDYLKTGRILTSCDKIITPTLEDFTQSMNTMWTDVRLSRFGTIEVRAIGQQPYADLMCFPALLKGIVNNLNDCQEAMGDYLSLLKTKRSLASSRGLDYSVGVTPITVVVGHLVQCAERGLPRHERHYLSPLYCRIDSQRNPADYATQVFLRKGSRGFIEHKEIKPEHIRLLQENPNRYFFK